MIQHPRSKLSIPALLLLGLGLFAGSGGALDSNSRGSDSDDTIPVSMQKLADIEYEPGDEIPEDVLAYDGNTVEISGFMRNGTIEGETWFDLTNDSCGCGTSKLQHFVRVTLEEGSTTFTPSELELTGSFEVSEKEDEDGFVESIYRLKIKSLDLQAD